MGYIERLFIAPRQHTELIRQSPDTLMLDTTYKTNRFRMPLFNICGISQQRQPFQIATVFLEGETEERFAWALNALRDYMYENGLRLPRCIVTDRDTALLKALMHHAAFKGIPRLLCRWHINMNVLAKTTPFFPKATRCPGQEPERHPSFQAFLKDWNELIEAYTSDQFDELLAKLQASRHPPDAIAYVVDTWVPHKHQFVRCFLIKVPHFGHTSTSIVEASHASLKRWIRASTGDLASVFRGLQQWWDGQSHKVISTKAYRMNKLANFTNTDLLSLVRDKVAPVALAVITQVLRGLPRRQNGVLKPLERPCRNPCPIHTTMGLPCKHMLHYYEFHRLPLELGDFDRHWWWQQPRDEADAAIIAAAAARPAMGARPPPALNPLPVKGKGRPKGAIETTETKGSKRKGYGKHSTKRELSAFERAAARERYEAMPPSTAPAALDCIVVGEQPWQQPRKPMPAFPAPLELSDDDDLDLGTVQPRAYQRHFVALLNEPDEEEELRGLCDDNALIPEQFEGGMDRDIQQEEVLDIALDRFEGGLFEAEGDL